RQDRAALRRAGSAGGVLQGAGGEGCPEHDERGVSPAHRGAGGRVRQRGEEGADGRPQGAPERRRHPGEHLQRGQPGGRPDAGGVHGGVRQEEGLMPSEQRRRAMSRNLRSWAVLVLSLLAVRALAKDIEGTPIADQITAEGKTLRLIGGGIRTKWMFSV